MNQTNVPVVFHPSFLELAPVICFWTDTEGRLHDVSKLCAKLFGFKNRQEAEGTLTKDIPCHLATYAEKEHMVEKDIIASRECLTRVGISTFANHETLVLVRHKFPLMDENGNVFGVGCYCVELDNQMLKKMYQLNSPADAPQTTPTEAVVDMNVDNAFTDKYGLTRRESETLYFLLRGYTAKTIAEELALSKRTVEGYIIRIKSKLSCRTRQQIVEFCFKNDLTNAIPQSLAKKALGLEELDWQSFSAASASTTEESPQ